MNTLNNELEIERKLAIKLAEENSQLLNQQEEQRKFRENYFQREIPKIQQGKIYIKISL